jgi:hypothetical protein
MFARCLQKSKCSPQRGGKGKLQTPAGSRHFWTPINPNLPPRNPPRTPPSQVLALGNQTLINRAGQQGDAVPAHLITEVLADLVDTKSIKMYGDSRKLTYI